VKFNSWIEQLESRRLLSLTIDLRLVGGGKEVTVDHIGQTVSLEAWAIVTGSNADISDEGVQDVIGSFLSSNVGGGSALGDLSAVRVNPFRALGSVDPVQADLDGDGDLDAGSNNNTNADGFFGARSGSMTTDGAPAPGGGAQFKLADVSFVVTSLRGGTATELNFRVRVGNSGVWREDGVTRSTFVAIPGSVMTAGTPVVVHSSGVTGVGSISGFVFDDANQSGKRDAGETALSQWTVFLDSDQDGTLDTGETLALTDSAGAYTFANLSAGTYHVAQVLQAGYGQVAPATPRHDITLAAGEIRGLVDFANSTRGQIRGRIFEDSNLDHAYNGNDKPLGGWTVFIDSDHDGAPGAGEVSVITSADGKYTLGPLVPGQYDVRVVVQTNWVASTPLPRVVTVAPGAVLLNENIGLGHIVGFLSGTVINDLNGNGEQSTGEPPLAGWRVYLDADNDGQFDSGESFSLTTSSGAYSFIPLAPGTYNVRVELQDSFRLSNSESGLFVYTVSRPEQGLTNRNFFVTTLPPGTASITGSVYDDANANGRRDPGETGLANWGVYLDSNHNGTKDLGEANTFTDVYGVYTFATLASGTYRVRELLYPGYRRITPASGYIAVSLSAGTSRTAADFGNTKLASISGTVFRDSDGNGVRDAGEVGLSGWRVWDDLNNNGLLDSGEASTLTNSLGNYTLNVPAGWHYIRAQQKAGYARSGVVYYKILVGDSTRVYNKLFGEKPLV